MDKQKEKRLIFCGHSLAGSIAHLCAIDVWYETLSASVQEQVMRDPEQWQLPDGATLEQVQVFGIGFGSHRVGNTLKYFGKWRHSTIIVFHFIFFYFNFLKQLQTICPLDTL